MVSLRRILLKLLPPRYQPPLNSTRSDGKLHFYVVWFVSSALFNMVIMITILVNCITVALETGNTISGIRVFLLSTDAIFLFVYVVEFILKLYAEPLSYWRSGYNLFDFLVLIVAIVDFTLFALKILDTNRDLLKIVRVFRSVRIFRFFSVIRGLRVLLTALLTTFLSAMVPFLVLLLILMYIYAIMGYYLFGYLPTGDKEKWGTFGSAMLSLLTYVTADGWTDINDRLTTHGYAASSLFTVSFILLGHFLYTNLFIGIIIYNIHRATTTFAAAQKDKRRKFLEDKKADITQRQHRDILQLMERQIADNFNDFHEMTKEFQKTLRHHDFTYSTDLCTNQNWIDAFVTTLTHLENTKYRIKQAHSDMSKYLVKIRQTQLLENR